ncbi:MAG TPA: hypothetical protein VIK06_10720 [Candidatus Limnocylindrales bacterium]|jgi:hypothetical protein
MKDERGPNGEAPTETPAEAMDRLAVRLDGVRRSVVANAVEYDRAGVVFATRQADLLSFHLREEVVSAALKTPDTAPSARGAEWIALASAASDQFTLDRAAAWFESAWRLAGSTWEGARPN